MRFSFLLIFFGCVYMTFGAVNPIKEARKNMKNARYEEDGNAARKVNECLVNAEKSLLDALSGETDAKKCAELYYTTALVQRKFNDIENEKIFLKRSYDTTLYYNSIYKLYRYMEQCDSVERTLPRKNRKYGVSARKELLSNRVNLLNAGRFYLKKNNYPEAFRYLDLYLSSAEYPMFEHDFLHQKDTMFIRVAYWAVTSAYYAGNYAGVVRYAPIAFRYNKDQEFLQEYVCRSYCAMGDSAQWISSLKIGLLNFPEHTYFFTNLISELNNKGRYDESLECIDKMLQYDSKSELAWHAKALTYMLKEDLDKCISVCNVLLALDSMNTEANRYKGLSYCKQARKFSDKMEKETLGTSAYKTYKQEMMSCYAKALGPMEVVRKKQPQDAERWAPLLYQIYLNLNKGPEFAEIDNIMKRLPLRKNN